MVSGMRGRRTLVYGVTVPSVAQSFLRGQLAFMADAGWAVTLVCSPGRGLDLVREREGVEVIEITTPRDISPIADLKSLLAWIRLLRQIRPDVLNVSTPKAGLIGAIAGFLTRVPKRVYVVRGLRFESERGWRRRMLILMERLTIACSTDVIAVSDSLRQELVAQRISGRTAPLVLGAGSSNGVDAPGIGARVDALDRSVVRKGFGILGDDTFVVAFIGRIRNDKGVPELVEALQHPELRDAVVIAVGDAEEPELAASLKSLGDRLILIEWMDDVAPVLTACDVLCLPTHREGFPNVVLEAAAAGRPAVTTTATGARDSVIDGATGLLVPVGDPDALAVALCQLASDPELRWRMGDNARRRVLRDFAPEVIWRGLEDVFTS